MSYKIEIVKVYEVKSEVANEFFKKDKKMCIRDRCVFGGSSLKSAGVDGDIINAHDKNHTAGCDKGKNEFLKFCFWHSKPSL